METGGGVSIGTRTSGLISSATKKESWKFVIFCSLILIDCWFTRIACVCVCVCVCVCDGLCACVAARKTVFGATTEGCEDS